jgi:hypothetical protein
MRRLINSKVMIYCVPGHSDVHGDKEVDKQAKIASEGQQQNSPNA